MQQGQVFELKKRAVDGRPAWAYRYGTDGPGSRRLQRGGFFSERDAAEALERELEHLRRQKGVGSTLTLKELVEEYVAQYDAEPETIEKLCWLLAKALRTFGGRRLPELRSQEIAAWRMTISAGHRFEATQALRQVLARAVVWGMIDSNPAKQGVDNPQRRRTEKRPFESWAQLELAARLGPRYGPPVLFAAATGLRPGEWMALEQRDIDRQARVVYVRRALRNGRLKSTKTEGSIRAVPLQAIALAALDQLGADCENQVLFPSPRGGYFDLHNFRNRYWKPAQIAAGVVPLRRVCDLRHTFATFGAPCRHLNLRPLALHGPSLTMIDRHYGHLARDGREHAIRLLDGYADIKAADVQALDVRWTPPLPIVAGQDNGNSA
jgi:integrase